MAAFATRAVFDALGDAADVLPWTALAILATSGLVIALTRIAEGVLAERLGQSFAHALRSQLFDHISRLPSSFVRNQRQGGLALRFVGDLGAVRGWVSKGLTRLISAPIVLICTLAALSVLDPNLCVAAAVPVAVGLAAMAAASVRAAPLYATLRRRRARLSADMTERVAIAPELRLLGRIGREQNLLARKSRRLTQAAVRKTAAAGSIRAIPDLVSGFSAALVLLMALLGDLPAATVAGALAAVGLMISPMRDLAGVADRNREWAVARQKCKRLLAAGVPDIIPDNAPRRPRPTAPGLTFKAVHHGPLWNLNLKLHAGQKVGIIAGNAEGKTTLLALAAGLDQPSAGQVRVGGVPANMLPLKYRTRNIALLGSRSPVLSGSLRRALTLGLTRRPDDAIILAAAHRFELNALLDRPGGLDARVSEGGRNLSVGELWRILMARLHLGDFDLILVDAPETALDRAGISLLATELHRRPSTVLVATGNHDLPRALGLDSQPLDTGRSPHPAVQDRA